MDRLEVVGLLQRRADANDKRMNRLYLTNPGRKLVTELLAEHFVLVREMMRPLSDSQQRQLRALLQLLEEG